MQLDLTSCFFGVCIMAFGFFLMRTHWAMWVRQQQEFIDDPRELRHLQNRFHRRFQTSGLIAFVGLLIPIADLPLVWNQGPLLPTILWIGIVGVILWIVALAFGDFVSTHAHSRATMLRLEARKQELLGQVKRMRPDAESSDE